MHHNYGVISGSHACRDCVWHIILDAELYTTYPGERVLVATRFNVTFLPLRLCYENTRTCFSKDAENRTTYDYVLWCSLIDCIFPILWTLQSHFALWMSDRNLQYPFDWWRFMSQCFRILPRLDQFRNWRPTPQWCCNKCYVLANNSVKNVSVTLWFCLQCSCKKCL